MPKDYETVPRASHARHAASPPPEDAQARPSRRVMLAAGAGAAALAVTGTAVPADAEQPLRHTPMPLADRVALVTGAARGIGRATALRLARDGADVVLVDIAGPVSGAGAFAPATLADLAQTERQVRALGRRALAIRADVRDHAALQAAVDRTVRELGRLDVAVANAGIAAWAPFAEMTSQQWQVVQDVNLTGVFNTLRTAATPMIAAKRGRLIALTSIGGRMGVAGVANYAATKWGVIGLVKSVALELGPHNITVNAVAPCAVNTPLYRSEGQAHSTGVDTPAAQDGQTRQFNALPVAALEPGDVADGIAFLASDAAKYVSGLVLDVAAGGNARYSA